jgi:hypothetical protein
MKAIALLKTFICSLILAQVTDLGAVSTGSTGRSFALFSVSYNSSGSEAQGGVCGTVFFISENQAVTAYHVINAESFKPNPGFQKKRLWLVHEGEAPIEVKPEFLRSDRLRDLTMIRLPSKIAKKFIFEQGPALANAAVESEGFVASSTGPVLSRQGLDIAIVSVPRLQRVFAKGLVIRKINVDMKAIDVELDKSPSVQVSYAPIVGMSGGPVVSGGRVIAMNSFADPGTRKSTWALELEPGISRATARP